MVSLKASCQGQSSPPQSHSLPVKCPSCGCKIKKEDFSNAEAPPKCFHAVHVVRSDLVPLMHRNQDYENVGTEDLHSHPRSDLLELDFTPGQLIPVESQEPAIPMTDRSNCLVGESAPRRNGHIDSESGGMVFAVAGKSKRCCWKLLLVALLLVLAMVTLIVVVFLVTRQNELVSSPTAEHFHRPHHKEASTVGSPGSSSYISPDMITGEMPLKFRLIGGARPSIGRVEIEYDGKWGTVCDDFFDRKDAIVICTMMGYNNASRVRHINNVYGLGNGSVLLSGLLCHGTEKSLHECEHDGWQNANCQHDEDVAVDCEAPFHDPTVPPAEPTPMATTTTSTTPKTTTVTTTKTPLVPIEVHLAGGNASRGRVEVRRKNEEWGTICDDYFDQKDAIVICRMLGFKNETLVEHITNTFGHGSGKIQLSSLMCRGTETNIAECPHDGWGKTNCEHKEDVAVDCNKYLH